MKRIVAIGLFTIVVFVTASGARAQDLSVQASVPIAFTVGNESLPPGNYEITTPSSGVIEARNRYNSVAILTQPPTTARDFATEQNWSSASTAAGYFLARFSAPTPP
jgi:hypothetical protein